jgi:hypothetical protein
MIDAGKTQNASCAKSPVCSAPGCSRRGLWRPTVCGHSYRVSGCSTLIYQVSRLSYDAMYCVLC